MVFSGNAALYPRWAMACGRFPWGVFLMDAKVALEFVSWTPG